MKRTAAFVLILLFACALVGARPFTVVVYHVENLFDVDGVAVYDDYQSTTYGPPHLRTKVENIARTMAKFDDGRGPDVILFQEIEADQTPDIYGELGTYKGSWQFLVRDVSWIE